MKHFFRWIEIPAVDFNRAVTFYAEVFKIDFKVADYGTEKMAFFPKDEGAISFAPNFLPSKDGVLVSLSCEEAMDTIVSRIIANGGSILQAKTKIEAENRGFFAIFVDCEGNRMGLYSEF